MKLAYYSTRRDRRGGWMQLELGARRRQGAGSTAGLPGSIGWCRRAAEVAAMRGIELNEATLANLEALGDQAAGTWSVAMRDLLRVEDLHVRFAAPGGFIEAVRGVSFRMRPASTIALVGESGSGKSVVSQSILRILPRNGEITGGAILFADPRGDGRAGRSRPIAGRRTGDAGDPRRPDLDHLSGADELLVAVAHDRRSGRRGAAAAPQRERRRRPRS